jgi:hypothetical protein
MKVQSLHPEYVEYIPRDMMDGTLYISKKFRTASHRCCCGCGTKIVTPLRETEYTLTERGGLVSLRPSIGNWNHPCQSHYWVRDNQIVWAGRMSRREIRRGRAYDEDLKRAYFAEPERTWWRQAGSWLGRQLRNLFGQSRE